LSAASVDKIEFKGIFRFDMSFWLVVGLCFTFYSAISPSALRHRFFYPTRFFPAGRLISASEAIRVWLRRRLAFLTACCHSRP